MAAGWLVDFLACRAMLSIVIFGISRRLCYSHLLSTLRTPFSEYPGAILRISEVSDEQSSIREAAMVSCLRRAKCD